MLQITPQMRILVAVEAVDFRKGIDSLAELCRAKLNADPFSGCLFVFRSRRATSIKVLVYDLCEVLRYVELSLASAPLSLF
jgi:transposase